MADYTSKQFERLGACFLLMLHFAGARAATADNWPGWRGDGSGVSHARDIPIYWDAAANIAWKASPKGEGNSSPIVWSDRLFVTAASKNGAVRYVHCLDVRNGTLLWSTKLRPTRKTRTYPKSGYAPSTPVTDGRRVYAFFDSPGLVCLDAVDGSVVWTRDLGPFKTPYNMASSPILCNDLVILVCDVNNGSFIIAMNRADGTTRWKVARDTRYSSASPLRILANGKEQIVVNGKTIYAYRPRDGRLLWRCRGMKPYVTPTAVFDGRWVYAVSGRNGPIIAIDPAGENGEDITDTGIRWFLPSGGPYVPSPVLVDGLLFVPGDNGAFRFVDPRKGIVISTGRLHRGWFSASPAALGRRIYWSSESGDTYVIDASGVRGALRRAKVVGINSLGEGILASPAITRGRLFLRTRRHIFCISGHERRSVPASAPEETATAAFAELQARYEARKGRSDDDAKAFLRVEIVDALARYKSAPVLDFLEKIARNDNNWNVCQEAATVLAATGWAARKQLLHLAAWRRAQPYMKILAAEGLGRIAYGDAVPVLLRLANDHDPLVRIAAVNALGGIGAKHPEQRAVILPVLAGALDDEEDTVKAAAVAAVSRLGPPLGARSSRIIARLTALARGRNPLLAARARAALRDSFARPADSLAQPERRLRPSAQPRRGAQPPATGRAAAGKPGRSAAAAGSSELPAAFGSGGAPSQHRGAGQ